MHHTPSRGRMGGREKNSFSNVYFWRHVFNARLLRADELKSTIDDGYQVCIFSLLWIPFFTLLIIHVDSIPQGVYG